MATWHKEVFTAIDAVVQNPQICALYRRWVRAREATGATPALADFDQHALADLAANVMVLEEAGGDFTYRYYGRAIAQQLQADMTGKRVSAFGGDIAAYFLDSYRRAVTSQRPLYTVHFAKHAPLVLTWERLLMPLKDAAGRDWIGAYCVPLEMRPKLLEAVLNATSDAILALRHVPGLDGAADDWLILLANADCATLLGVHAGELVGKCVSEAVPRWRELKLDAHCRDVLHGEAELLRELELPVMGDIRHFSAYFARLGQGCVVRLTDVSALKRAELALRQHATRLQSANAQLETLATRDGLTGLFNRRALDGYLEREVASARRSGEALCVAVCDIDHFKAYNDLNGHLAGDDAIREVAAALSASVTRATDVAARFGGEEFVLVMRQTPLLGALEVLHRAQHLLRQREIRHPGSTAGPYLTLSFGVAEFDPVHDAHPGALLARADAALYRAKQGGRNRVETDE